MSTEWTNTIVVSAVNLVEGGTFTILQECLSALSSSEIAEKYRVVALVHGKENLPSRGIEYIEYPKAKKSYFYRMYYEYFAFKKVSDRLKPRLWLSLHDMSPRVKAGTQAVYMHNPTPFYKPKYRDWKYVPINAIWAYLYKYLYQINIHSNKYLIVQQQWIRHEFSKMFVFPEKRIIVARPENENTLTDGISAATETTNDVYTFFFPALPRVFKNHDVVCEAAGILESRGVKNVKIILTIDGTENGYAKNIKEKYSRISSIEFAGIIPKNRMLNIYKNVDCLLFPSKLETWGLPLSEFKIYGKPMLVADLPYAHETTSGAHYVSFFNPDDADELANKMESLVNNDKAFLHEVPALQLEEPNVSTWEELIRILLN